MQVLDHFKKTVALKRSICEKPLLTWLHMNARSALCAGGHSSGYTPAPSHYSNLKDTQLHTGSINSHHLNVSLDPDLRYILCAESNSIYGKCNWLAMIWKGKSLCLYKVHQFTVTQCISRFLLWHVKALSLYLHDQTVSPNRSVLELPKTPTLWSGRNLKPPWLFFS